MRSTKHPVDLHVGAQIKLRRGLMGLSQTDLAKGLGITFQQVQKYENGANRVGASRLFEIAQILGVSVQYFYEGAQDESRRSPLDSKVEGPDRLEDFIRSPMGIDICRAFVRIEDPELKSRLAKLVKTVSESQEGNRGHP